MYIYIYIYIYTEEKSDANLQEKPVCSFNNDKNLVNFDPSTQKSKKFAL